MIRDDTFRNCLQTSPTVMKAALKPCSDVFHHLPLLSILLFRHVYSGISLYRIMLDTKILTAIHRSGFILTGTFLMILLVVIELSSLTQTPEVCSDRDRPY